MMLSAPIKDTDSSLVQPDQTCKRFTFAEIQSATHNFDETLVIGRGGFGKVYKCPTNIGLVSEVAVKRLHSMSNQGADEFEAEVKLLSKLRHGNLVSLIGYCNDEKEMVLIYEFMPNGTLEDHLLKPDSSLSWLQRLKICVGAARGLDYLHTGTSTQHGVIHRDVKTSNILLDANFAAKISDFGLAKVGLIDQTRTHVSTAVKGTFGYMDPCYFYTGKLTRKSDVYAFGVVLFEALSGRKAVDSTLDEEQWGLAVWAQDQIKEGKLNKIIDPRLNGQISKKCLKEFANIAGHCLHTQPKRRPTMAEVVVKLESILSQERESTNSVVYDEGFIYKLRYFFTGKVDSATESNSNIPPLAKLIADELDAATESKVDSATESNSNIPPLAKLIADELNAARGSNIKQSFRYFTYDELVRATNGFKYKEHSPTLNLSIYKGWVDERTYEQGAGLAMYVRKMELPTPKTDFKLEEFNHPNLVKLLGYCVSTQELFCVYELNPYKSLDKYLYSEPGTTSLSWVGRLKIAMGAAEGLFYLQKKNQPAYSQFLTNFILVDTDFNARLSDYVFVSYTSGMNMHYAAPEWFRYQADIFDSTLHPLKPKDGFAVKSEIYAFGVVLLEILTGLKVYDENRPLEKQKLVKWAIPLLGDEVNLGTIMDPQLQHDDYSPKVAFKLAQLVLQCLQPKQDQRPVMEEILLVLHYCYQEETKTV